jgi:hypothetical protein
MLITTTPAIADGATTFALSGRFDAHEADVFRSAVDPAIETGNPAKRAAIFAWFHHRTRSPSSSN